MVKEVPEPQLAAVLSKTISKPNEDLRRPMLARLTEKVRKGLNISLESICKESNLRRNKLVLEEIVRKRENE